VLLLAVDDHPVYEIRQNAGFSQGKKLEYNTCTQLQGFSIRYKQFRTTFLRAYQPWRQELTYFRQEKSLATSLQYVL
jgi:hypothetical protein